MKRAIVVLALLLASSGFTAVQAGAADAAPAGAVRLLDLDRGVFAEINAARASRGLRPLVLSDGLQQAAVAHSRSMLASGYFAHESQDGSTFVTRVKRYYSPRGYVSWSAGENLIYNTAELDAATAIRAWLASPAHRANMLSPAWREVGIGSLYAPSAGGPFGGEPTWVITVDFGARSALRKTASEKPSRTLSQADAIQPTRHLLQAKPPKPARRPKPPKPKPAGREVNRVLPRPVARHSGDA